MPTHKKGHDKDKYYHLAKDQGYRSRAAFKLIQINKRFDFLSKAKVCIDLCAAPGGWCQVAAKNMPSGSLILGIDLLPIKSIRNVKTIVADITTAECRRQIVSELQGWKADVVLCDGAPNIGSAYSKDAYIQNELVIAALKTATDHLVPGGTFCTKVYRSVDYNSVLWVLQQLFEDVQTMKPNSSRSQSSEIFLVCLKYTAPSYIDPKLLDPNHVFKEVADPGLKKVNVLHKKYDQSNKRQRSGYDESLGMTLRASTTVSEFFKSKEPIRMLTDFHQITFSDDELCQSIRSHVRTTEEITTCLDDLRLLGKLDFKKILRWRIQVRKAMNLDAIAAKKGNESESDEVAVKKTEKQDPAFLSEEDIQLEIAQLKYQQSQLDRKEKKKSRQLTAKERQRQYLGMTGNSFEVAPDMELFSIGGATTYQQLSEMAEVNLEDIDPLFEDDVDELELLREESMQKNIPGKKRGSSRSSIIEVTEENLEDELEIAYQRFLVGRRAKQVESGKDKELYNADGALVDTEGDNRTHSSKKFNASVQSDAKLAMREEEDALLMAQSESKKMKRQNKNNIYSEDLDAYVKMLNQTEKKKQKHQPTSETKTGEGSNNNEDGSNDFYKDNDSDDTSDEESDDGFDDVDDDDMIVDADGDGNGEQGRLVVSKDELSKQNKASKWFANPLFQSSLVTNDEYVDTAATTTASIPATKSVTKPVTKQSKKRSHSDAATSDEGDDCYDDDDREKHHLLDLMMPKTDKQLRKEQRKKDNERRERKERKQGRMLSELEEDRDDAAMNPLVKRSTTRKEAGSEPIGFEVVPAESEDAIATAIHDELLNRDRKDDRMYDSDDEDYDNHDKIRTLALGTMMLRHSKKKALVDASYNRFAWNDPKELPSWFLDDEMRHNKPQLPIPTALLEQIKSKFQKTGTKEIKKVAEARMRKKKRAAAKLKAAKKQANIMAESSDISERQKLKAISKAMRSNKIDKPGKVYVVTRKTKAGSSGTSGGGKGKLKFVDKRLRCDTRAMKKSDKKKGKKRK